MSEWRCEHMTVSGSVTAARCVYGCEMSAVEPVKPAELHKDFICRCGKPDHDEVLQRACRLLSEGSANGGYGDVDATNMVTAIVFHLHEDYRAMLTGIWTDQWSAVSAEQFHYEDHRRVVDFRTSIECDRVEDGIAATYLAFVDRFGIPTDDDLRPVVSSTPREASE